MDSGFYGMEIGDTSSPLKGLGSKLGFMSYGAVLLNSFYHFLNHNIFYLVIKNGPCKAINLLSDFENEMKAESQNHLYD